KFQPVYVDDVAQAAARGIKGEAHGTYELGGPDAETFRAIIAKMLTVIRRRRLVLNLPFFLANIPANLLDFASFATGGIFHNSILTRDQVASLRSDNVVAPGAKTLADLGITATDYASVIPEYLWRYRPSGQYAAIKESAKNLKKA
ncbi:MAG: complex I NDUFA9 subunit family protein, partial [Cypionkella sp.]